MIAYRETAGLAKQLVEHSCKPQGIVPGQLKLYVRLATEIGLFRPILMQAQGLKQYRYRMF